MPQLDGDGFSLRLAIGSLHGLRAPVKSFSPCFFADVDLSAGATYVLNAEHEERAFYLVSGEIEIEGVLFEPGRLVVVRPDAEVALRAVLKSRLVALGGDIPGGAAICVVEFRVVQPRAHPRRPRRLGIGQVFRYRGRSRVHPGAGIEGFMSFSKFFATRAPAKINLTLHIEGRRDDGYHELQSLVAFAGAADYLTFEPGEEFRADPRRADRDKPRARAATIWWRGPSAPCARKSPACAPGPFIWSKRLPVAAGMGGGSSDAAAALRLLARANGLSPDDPALYAAARKTGADVPVCLTPRGKMMSGIGERLGPPIKLPPLFAVLVNPRQPVETRAVFAKLGLKPGENNGYRRASRRSPTNMDFESLLRSLKKGRNDMEDAACVLAPVIGHVLAVLSGARGCRLARMSGSGATCFALFETCRQAGVAARAISRGHPEWWVKTTILR